MFFSFPGKNLITYFLKAYFYKFLVEENVKASKTWNFLDFCFVVTSVIFILKGVNFKMFKSSCHPSSNNTNTVFAFKKFIFSFWLPAFCKFCWYKKIWLGTNYRERWRRNVCKVNKTSSRFTKIGLDKSQYFLIFELNEQ